MPRYGNYQQLGQPEPSPGQNQQRSGKWTREEQEYMQELIEQFEDGTLRLEQGISLRRFLSRMLDCNPKRISKKMEGTKYNGKQLYKPANHITLEEAATRKATLDMLARRYHESVRVLEMVEASKRTSAPQSVDCVRHASLSKTPLSQQASAALRNDCLLQDAVRLATFQRLGTPSTQSRDFLAAYMGTMNAGCEVPSLATILAARAIATPPRPNDCVLFRSNRQLPFSGGKAWPGVPRNSEVTASDLPRNLHPPQPLPFSHRNVRSNFASVDQQRLQAFLRSDISAEGRFRSNTSRTIVTALQTVPESSAENSKRKWQFGFQAALPASKRYRFG